MLTVILMSYLTNALDIFSFIATIAIGIVGLEPTSLRRATLPIHPYSESFLFATKKAEGLQLNNIHYPMLDESNVSCICYLPRSFPCYIVSFSIWGDMSI